MKKPLATVVIGVCLVLCVVATSCAEGTGVQVTGSQPRQEVESKDQQTVPATATPEATAIGLTRAALRNVEYAAGLPTYGTLQRDRIGAQDPLAFGDLNGDGVADAVVLLLLIDGNAAHRYLAAVFNENGAPRHVASAFLGFSIGIDSVTVENGVVTLQTKQLGPNDPNCCPTKEIAVTFRLADNEWQLLAETPPGSITTNFHTHADTGIIMAAMQALRSTEVGETVAAWFLDSGGTVTFDDAPFQELPDIPEIPFAIALDLVENRILLGTAHRGESAETLAAWLAGSMTQSISLTLEGDPSSVAACFDLLQLAYHARAAVWFEFYGDEGKPDANSQEAFLNQNLQRTMNGILAGWVRGIPYYRHFCEQFGASTTPTATLDPTPFPPTPIPASSPTSTAQAPSESSSCLSPAESEYLSEFYTEFWNSARVRRDSWFAAANDASAAYYGLNDIPTGNTVLRIVRLAGRAVEALRTYGLAAQEAISKLSPAPSERTAKLLNYAVHHYQTIESEYLGLIEHFDQPQWIQARVLPQLLARISNKTFEEVLDVAAKFDGLTARPRCE